MRTRLKLVAALFLIVFAVLSARLFFWQIIRGKDLSHQQIVINSFPYFQSRLMLHYLM